MKPLLLPHTDSCYDGSKQLFVITPEDRHAAHFTTFTSTATIPLVIFSSLT